MGHKDHEDREEARGFGSDAVLDDLGSVREHRLEFSAGKEVSEGLCAETGRCRGVGVIV